MKRFVGIGVMALALILVAGVSLTYAQATFKIPFKFQAGGQEASGGRLHRDRRRPKAGSRSGRKRPARNSRSRSPSGWLSPKPAVAGPRLVFDEVGDFEPSYTEYFTVYILSEVWLPGEDGFRVHTTKGAHQTKVVNGVSAKK